ncbi:hypothetical protein ABFT23_07175 [Nocardioides sp. C4-1]|uniref:hypothetical protein n=1 Tax=Nocardioides sp. C4-1 TaxID=3151851 RepID=UPI0032659DC8
MDDWQALVADLTWMGPPHHTGAATGPARPWDRSLPDWADDLAALLSTASVTPVEVDGRAWEIVGWDTAEEGRAGWLVPQQASAEAATSAGLHPDHTALVQVLGGITERFGEPDDTWLVDTDESLTLATALSTARGVLDAYEWAWDDDGLTCPIRPAERDDWYAISREANGNLTLAHRTSGRVVLFAPDHAFDDVTVLDGCPEYSLYTRDGAPDVRAWVNGVARQWRAGLS